MQNFQRISLEKGKRGEVPKFAGMGRLGKINW